jgi:hypothetical protein
MPPGHANGQVRLMNGTVTAIVLSVSAVAMLLLGQARQLMREIARTAEEWRRLKRAIRGGKRNTEPGHDEDQGMIGP